MLLGLMIWWLLSNSLGPWHLFPYCLHIVRPLLPWASPGSHLRNFELHHFLQQSSFFPSLYIPKPSHSSLSNDCHHWLFFTSPGDFFTGHSVSAHVPQHPPVTCLIPVGYIFLLRSTFLTHVEGPTRCRHYICYHCLREGHACWWVVYWFPSHFFHAAAVRIITALSAPPSQLSMSPKQQKWSTRLGPTSSSSLVRGVSDIGAAPLEQRGHKKI